MIPEVGFQRLDMGVKIASLFAFFEIPTVKSEKKRSAETGL